MKITLFAYEDWVDYIASGIGDKTKSSFLPLIMKAGNKQINITIPPTIAFS